MKRNGLRTYATLCHASGDCLMVLTFSLCAQHHHRLSWDQCSSLGRVLLYTTAFQHRPTEIGVGHVGVYWCRSHGFVLLQHPTAFPARVHHCIPWAHDLHPAHHVLLRLLTTLLRTGNIILPQCPVLLARTARRSASHLLLHCLIRHNDLCNL